MSNVSRNALVQEETTGYETVAAATVAVAALLFGLGFVALVEIVPITEPVAGIEMTLLLGGLLTALGLAVIGFGVGSRMEMLATAPQPSAGVIAGLAFSTVWFIVGGLVASQTFGLGFAGWFGVAVLAAIVAFLITAFPREDVGSTLPAGVFSILAGLSFVTGIIGPSWAWTPEGLNATFTAPIMVPLVVMFAALLTGWSAAKAYGGFGARGRHLAAHLLIYLNVLAILSVLFGLVAFVVVKGLPGLFQGFSLGGGTGLLPFEWPFVTNGVSIIAEVDGVLPAIVGTFWLVVGAVLFALPVGVGAAIFLSEYAEQGRFTQLIEIATNGLWSTPSIVFGLFGFAFLVPRFGNSKSLLSGMLTLGFMLLPLVVITSREAMLAVPKEYRDASAALGVSKWQTIRSVVLPAAIPGITTGVILGVGRIAGETAPILLTMAGGTFVPGGRTVDVIGGFKFTASPPFVSNPALLDATSALPYQLYALITAGLQNPSIGNPQNFQWGLALTLLIVVLSFYAVGIATRYYFRKRLHQ